MTIVTIYSPSGIQKRAPRVFKCSDCRHTIEQGSIYYRHNHGRYCVTCSTKHSEDSRKYKASK